MVSTEAKKRFTFHHSLSQNFLFYLFILKPNQKFWRTWFKAPNFGLSTKTRINYSHCCVQAFYQFPIISSIPINKRTIHPGCFPLVPIKTNREEANIVKIVELIIKLINSESNIFWSIDNFTRNAPIHQPKNEDKCQVAQIIRKCRSFNSVFTLDGTKFPLFLLSLKIKYSPRIE
jgi:hypothetical protein